MIGQPKPLASLSSGLLARKGHARPAMRPQGFGGFGPMGNVHEDLGWNDMGDHEPQVAAPTPAPVVAMTPAFEAEQFEAKTALPQVLRQREVLQEELAAAPEFDPEPAAMPVRTISPARVARIGKEVGAKKNKVAFTLRLDGDRHLQLRLASAVTGRSSQQLVTQALDQFLTTLPEVADLASQLPASRGHAVG